MVFNFFRKRREQAGKGFRGVAEGMIERGVKERIARENVPIKDLAVEQSAGRITLKGGAATKEDAEKALRAARNAPGLAHVQSEIKVVQPVDAAQQPAEQARTYTVKLGDTLSKIAKDHYGDASKYPLIFEANRPLLKDPDRIFPGQVLRIPFDKTPQPSA